MDWALLGAMARQAEAERERRAKIINAEGEFQAAQKIYEAAEILSRNPAALQLRYLQTLLELGGEKSTIVFPLPLDFGKPFLGARRKPSGAPAAPRPDLSIFGDALHRFLVDTGLAATSDHSAGDHREAWAGMDVPDESDMDVLGEDDLEPDDGRSQPR